MEICQHIRHLGTVKNWPKQLNSITVHWLATDENLQLTFEILSVAVSCDLFLNSFSIHAIFEGLLFPQKAYDPLQFNRMDFT